MGNDTPAEDTGDKLQPDDWVSAVLRDQPDGAVAIFAYVGGHDEKGNWKLYTTADLNEYLVVGNDDIVKGIQLDSEYFPLGGSIVWIKRDATVRSVVTTSLQIQASMLAEREFTTQASAEEVGDNLPQPYLIRHPLTSGKPCGWLFLPRQPPERR